MKYGNSGTAQHVISGFAAIMWNQNGNIRFDRVLLQLTLSKQVLQAVLCGQTVSKHRERFIDLKSTFSLCIRHISNHNHRQGAAAVKPFSVQITLYISQHDLGTKQITKHFYNGRFGFFIRSCDCCK